MGKRDKGVSRAFLLSEAPSTLCLGDTARNLQPNIPQSTTLRKEKNPQSWSCHGRGLALPKGEGWNIPRFSHCSLSEALAGSLSEAESGQGRHRTVLRQSSPVLNSKAVLKPWQVFFGSVNPTSQQKGWLQEDTLPSAWSGVATVNN